MKDEAPSQRRGRIYWPLVWASIGVGVIAVPIGFFITASYAFSGVCGETANSCSGPEPASHYVISLIVLSAAWLTVVAILLYNREDTIPFPAVLIGLVATAATFHGLLWAGLFVAEDIRSWVPLLLMVLAPFASVLSEPAPPRWSGG